jgi:hypothetical protein
LEKTIEVDIVSKIVTENATEISSENKGLVDRTTSDTSELTVNI